MGDWDGVGTVVVAMLSVVVVVAVVAMVMRMSVMLFVIVAGIPISSWRRTW